MRGFFFKLFVLCLALPSATYASGCSIFLKGHVTSKQINYLLDHGYDIAGRAEDATYLMDTKLTEESTFRVLHHDGTGGYHYATIYKTLIYFYKDGKVIRVSESLQNTDNSTTNADAIAFKPQRKIIKKVGECPRE